MPRDNKAVINNEIAKYISPGIDYEILDFSYDSSEYHAVQNKKYQLLIVHDTPERLPFISLNATTNLERDVIYVRRGTKCEKASAEEIEKMINYKIETIFKDSSDLSLQEHLSQLKQLYGELPKTIRVLVKKGEPPILSTALSAFSKMFYGSDDIYEYMDNPNYPDESYEAFISRMIGRKKLKIEKVLDLI